jgi:hypothetical protein
MSSAVSGGHCNASASLTDRAIHSKVRGWKFPTRNSRNLLQAHFANETTMTLVESDATIPWNRNSTSGAGLTEQGFAGIGVAVEQVVGQCRQ